MILWDTSSGCCRIQQQECCNWDGQRGHGIAVCIGGCAEWDVLLAKWGHLKLIMQQLDTILWPFALAKTIYPTCLSMQNDGPSSESKGYGSIWGSGPSTPVVADASAWRRGAAEETGCNRSLDCRKCLGLSPVAQQAADMLRWRSHSWTIEKVRSHLRVLRRITEHWQWWERSLKHNIKLNMPYQYVLTAHKASYTLGYIRSMTSRLREVILLLCSTLTRPHLEYSVPPHGHNIRKMLTCWSKSWGGHKDDQMAGLALLWRQVEKVGFAQPGEETPGRSQSTFHYLEVLHQR